MNNQEAFDIIVTHLRKQGKKSLSIPHPGETPVCLYRGPDGLKCAAGALISDEEYFPNIEGLSIDSLLRDDECPRSLRLKLNNVNTLMLTAFQLCHDRVSVEEWEQQFQYIANNYGLTLSPKE